MSTDVDRPAGSRGAAHRPASHRPGTPHPVAAPLPRRRPALVVILGAVASAWLVPWLAVSLGAGWLLPPLIWLGVAALLRGGRTLLDRLVLALALLMGTTCVAGLVLSVWPWHLSPVPVSGVALTALVGLAVTLRRRPALPWRCPPGDRLVLALGGLALCSLLWPYRGLNRPARLGMVAAGGDLASHFSIVDGIRRAGGYLFLRPADPRLWDGLRTYPQGLHFITALLLGFLPHSGGTGLPLRELDVFIWFAPVSFALLCLVLVWAMRRIAGPGAPALALLAPAALATGYLLWSDPLYLLWLGYWPEIVGLTQLAILVALLVRPISGNREQVLVVTALLVALAYTYFLLLPIAGALTLAWLCWHRPRRNLGYTAAMLGSGAVASAVMPVACLLALGAGARITDGGTIIGQDNRTLAALGLLAVAGLAAGFRWRSRAWRMMALLIPASVALCVAIGGYQLHRTGEVMYYYFKAVHVLTLAVLLCLATLTRLLGPVLRRSRVGGLALGLAALVAFGPLLAPGVGRLYLDRSLAWMWVGRAALSVARSVPARPDTVTVVWSGRDYGYAAQTSQWVNVLWRTNGVSWRGQMWVAFEPRTGDIPRADIESLAERSAPYRIRFVTDQPALLSTLDALRRSRPDLRLDVVYLRLPE